MFDEYKESQKVVYEQLVNEINKNKYSHAYLFEANGNPEALNFAISFAKVLLCPHHYLNDKKCENCTQCHRINKNIFTDLKVLEPEGLWIKKDQLDELQREFSVKSLEAGRKVYIINQAEKLNKQAANSILKFLEEPEDNIYAILITNNIYQLLGTIISRCQKLSLSRTSENIENLNYDKEKLDSINKFVLYLEKNKLDTLVMTNKLWHSIFKDRVDYNEAYELLLTYYKEVLNFKLGRNIEIFNDNLKDLEYISSNNSFEKIIYKINIINDIKENIKVNANQSLLLDKLIIELVRGDQVE